MLELPSELPADIEVTPEYLAKTPEPVLQLLANFIEALDKSRKRNDELEAKISRNSSNSNKPLSTDSPLIPVKAKGKTNRTVLFRVILPILTHSRQRSPCKQSSPIDTVTM